MKKTLITLLGIVLCGAAVAVEKPAGATMEQYVDALMRRMTLEEKIGQLNLPSAGDITTGQAKSSDIAEKIRRGEVGGLFNIKGVEKIRDVQRIAVEESRLGIPLIFGMDVIHGYETTFPIPLGLTATWDMEAVERAARISAVEASAAGICWTFSPMVDIARDPRRYLLDLLPDGRHCARSPLGTCVGGHRRRSLPRQRCGAVVRLRLSGA